MCGWLLRRTRLWMGKLKVAAIVRVRVRGGVIRVAIPGAGIGAIVPVATAPDRPDDVRVDEVGVRVRIPFLSDHHR